MDAPERTVAPTMDSIRTEAATRLIVEIAAAASGELDLDQILHQALDRLRRVVRLTGGSIALVEGDDLIVRAAVGPFAAEALGQRLPRGPSRSWGVIERLQPYRTGDLARDGGRMRGAEAARAVHSWLAVPIARRGLGIGLLEIDSTEADAFEPADEELLSGVVAVLAGHVELAAHHEADRRSAELREAFVGVISHELRTPISPGSCVSVVTVSSRSHDPTRSPISRPNPSGCIGWSRTCSSCRERKEVGSRSRRSRST